MDKPLVLIADDDDNIRNLYETAFELEGFETLTAENGNKAVDLALEQHPNIILMDITMPEMDGHAAVDEIRKDPWGKTAKIMYLTNLGDAGNLMDAVERKSDEYIVKSNLEPKEVVEKAKSIMYSVRPPGT